MNNRLEDLMYRAGLTAQGCWDEMDSYQREAVEKFALLIVEECMEQLNISNVPAPISAGLNLGRVAIKEHFGV